MATIGVPTIVVGGVAVASRMRAGTGVNVTVPEAGIEPSALTNVPVTVQVATLTGKAISGSDQSEVDQRGVNPGDRHRHPGLLGNRCCPVEADSGAVVIEGCGNGHCCRGHRQRQSSKVSPLSGHPVSKLSA